jgi:hypothetical protein
MTDKVTQGEILRFARAGALARLAELEREMEFILATFPDLKESRAEQTGKRPPRQLWDEAQRKAISERMRRYWAKRRAEKARGGANADGTSRGRRRGSSSRVEKRP